jgi:hypothetical protein
MFDALAGRTLRSRPPTPTRFCSSARSWLTFKTTWPLRVVTVEPPPSSTSNSCSCALRLAFAHSACTSGRESAFKACFSTCVRRALAAGTASTWARGGRTSRTAASTSTVRKSSSDSRSAMRARITGCSSSSVLVRVQLSVLSTWRFVHTESAARKAITEPTRTSPVATTRLQPPCPTCDAAMV